MGNTLSSKIQYLFTVCFPLTLTLSTCFHNYLGHHIPTWSVLHLPVPALTFVMRVFHTWASALRFLCNILHSLLGSEQFIHNHLFLAHSLCCKVLWVLTDAEYHLFAESLIHHTFILITHIIYHAHSCPTEEFHNPKRPGASSIQVSPHSSWNPGHHWSLHGLDDFAHLRTSCNWYYTVSWFFRLTSCPKYHTLEVDHIFLGFLVHWSHHWAILHYRDTPRVVCPFTYWRTAQFLLFGVIMSKAAVNIRVQISVQTQVSRSGE